MIRIDHLQIEDFIKHEDAHLLMDSPLLVSPEREERSPSPEALHACPAVVDPKDPLKLEKFDGDMIIASCGLTNFEDSALSNKTGYEFQE